MKKHFSKILIISLLCSFSAVKGQVLIGPTAGGQVSWITYDDKDFKDLYKTAPVPGYHAGVTVSFRVQDRFFLTSSFLYSTKGKELKGKVDPLLYNKVTYRYIDIPMAYTAEFKSKVGRSREYKWYFGMGPNISYWLGGTGVLRNTDLTEQSIAELNYRINFGALPEEAVDEEMGVEDPNRIQLGLNITAGLVFQPIGLQKFLITARYELGHSNLSRTSQGVFSNKTLYGDVLQAENNGVRISLAYLVDLKVDQRKKGKSTLKIRRR